MIKSILLEMDTEPTELFGSILTLVWGLWLLAPWQTFKSSAAYNDLALIPEPILGGFLTISGVLLLICLTRGLVWRRYSTMACTAIWFSIGSMFFHSDSSNTGAVAYFLVAVSQGWAYIRIGLLANGR